MCDLVMNTMKPIMIAENFSNVLVCVVSVLVSVVPGSRLSSSLPLFCLVPCCRTSHKHKVVAFAVARCYHGGFDCHNNNNDNNNIAQCSVSITSNIRPLF